MEKIIPYKVNFDYEYELFNDKYSEKKFRWINEELEYLYFFCGPKDHPLLNYKKYDEHYLKFLEKLGFEIPAFISSSNDYFNWWGALENKELERKLNSKVTSLHVSKEINAQGPWGMEVKSLKNLKDFLASHDNRDWFYREESGVAGRGNFLIEAGKKNHTTMLQKLKIPGVLTEFLKKKTLDIGSVFDLNSSPEIKTLYFNHTTKGGQFGGIFSPISFEDRIKFMERARGSFYTLERELKEASSLYKSMGAKREIQFDSLIYKMNDNYHLYTLVEANYRKTMGQLFTALEANSPANGFGSWINISKNNFKGHLHYSELLKILNKDLYQIDTKLGIIPTSPADGKFISFYISAKSFSDYKKRLIDLGEKLLKSNHLVSKFLPKL